MQNLELIRLLLNIDLQNVFKTKKYKLSHLGLSADANFFSMTLLSKYCSMNMERYFAKQSIFICLLFRWLIQNNVKYCDGDSKICRREINLN